LNPPIVPTSPSKPPSRRPTPLRLLIDAIMSLKREADASFIKPDPGKRIKRERVDGDFSLYSIPMAPPHAANASPASSTFASKIEGGDRKPLVPVSFFQCYFPLWFGQEPGAAKHTDDLLPSRFCTLATTSTMPQQLYPSNL
jgi:hypothetical protein